MHRPSLNFPTLLKSSLAALVIAAGLLSTSGVLLAGTPGNCGEGYIEIYSATGANTCQKQTTAGPVADGTTAAAPAVVPNTTQAPDDSMLGVLATVASNGASGLGQLVVTVLGITIPLMQYQGFTSSLVVGAGWAIVRDVVNMFFVIILIVIAMMTIFGSSSVQWRQAVPKLMIMALVINFSKTLCGLMIDFSQVIMLTFANALKDIAGGNFIQLLGLGPILSLSSSSTETIGSFDLFAASAAAFLMMVWVLAIVVMLMFILVYRIVMLWILIVVAPLAWFTKVVPFASAKAAYADWWKSFVCYCSVGPVITFFLWLTLAVAGAGSIAANDPGFSATGVAVGGVNPTGGLTKIFELEHLSSFVIGMALLVAGMDAAAKVCAGVKGPGFSKMLAATKGGGFINQGAASVGKWAGKKGGEIGAKAVKGTASAAYGLGAGTLAAGGAVAGYVAKNALGEFARNPVSAKAGDGMIKGAMMNTIGIAQKMASKEGQADLLGGASELATRMGVPLVGGAASAKLARMSGAKEKEHQEEIKAAGKAVLSGDTESQIGFLSNMADGGKPSLPTQQKEGLAVLMAATKNSDMRKRLSDKKDPKTGKSDLEKLTEMYGDDMAGFSKTSEMGKEVREFKKKRPDLFGKGQIEKISKENVGEMDAAAYENTDVREQLTKTFTDRVKSTDQTTGEVTYFNELEDAREGRRGQYKKTAAGRHNDYPPTTRTMPVTSAPPVVTPAPPLPRRAAQEAENTRAAEEVEYGPTMEEYRAAVERGRAALAASEAAASPAPTARNTWAPVPTPSPAPEATLVPPAGPPPTPLPTPPRRPPPARPTVLRPVTPAAGAPTTTTTTTPTKIT